MSEALKVHLGLRNTAEQERFEAGELSEAMNVDIDATGQISSRAGTVTRAAGAAHSLWSDGAQAFVVQSGQLCRFVPPASVLPLGVLVADPVRYVSVGSVVYWSDGVRSGAIDGAPRAWGLPVPTSPLVQLVPGDMPAGIYRFCSLAVDSAGREHGASEPVLVELSAPYAVAITLPAVSGAAQHLYMTMPGGELLFFAGVYSASGGVFTVNAPPNLDLPLRTAGKGPAPAGQLVGRFGGRTFVASANLLWHSDPLEPELFDMAVGYTPFEAPITLFAPVSDGVFIGTTEETLFLEGADPSEWRPRQVSTASPVLGTAVPVAGNRLLKDGVPGAPMAWLSDAGVCLGLDGGEVRVLTEGRWTPPTARRGAAHFRNDKKLPQLLSCLFN